MWGLLLWGAAAAFAQFDTATVSGVVHDQANAVVVNSKVTLENVATGVVKVGSTDQNGSYTFFDVRIGRYKLKAEAPGFKAAVAEEFAVTVGAHQRVDLQLVVGSVSESVEVVGAASAIETDSSSRGHVIANQSIVNLPLNGRSYADLALLAPGVRKSMLEDGSASSRDASFNVNGQRSALNNFMVDGVDNNAYGTSNQGFSNQVVQLTPDSVAEFRVETSNFSAEYGRAAGAVINAATKTGTNSLHGSVWEYLRNTNLNAVGFFKPLNNIKPVYQQNQFGATLGGAIKKDKLFYFVDFEGLRRIQRTLTFATLPTADQRAGRFGVPIRNPLTNTLYSDGNLPANQITGFAKAVLDGLPLPNLPGLSNNFQSLPRATITDNKGDARADYYFTERLTGYFRYSHRVQEIYVPGNIPGPSGGNANGNVRIVNRQMNPGATWTISPSTTLEARLGVTWTEGGKSPIGVGEPDILGANGITGLPTDPRLKGGLNSQGVGGGFSQFGRQTSNPQFQNPFVVNPKINLGKLWGRHTLRIGYEWQMINTAIDDFNPVYGNDSYSGQFSRPAGTATNGPSASQQAYNLTDFMTGARSSYELNNYVIVDYRQRMHFAYVQDDFKVNRKLTLNLGLRYEFATPQWEADNHLANFDPGTNTLIPAKSGSLYDRALVQPRHKYFAPRIGLAYQILPKTVIRSAYGISYVHFNRLGGENLLSYNGPYIVDALINQDPSNLPVCASASADPVTCFRPTQMGYPANFAVPANFNPLRAQARYIPKNNPTGYIQSWHFTVQREIARNLVLDVAYVGNRGTHIMILADYNQARPNNANENLSLQARRPITNFANIEVAYGAGYSSYNALQLKLEKRYSAGLMLINSFTWSKGIDNASGHLEVQNGDSSRANIRDLRNEKGVSGYNQPVNNTLSAVYQLPFGKGRKHGAGWNGLMDGVFGGWQLTLITTATSGLPINITYSPTAQFQVTSIGLSVRPNVVGPLVTPEGSRTTLNYLNRASIAIPTDPSKPFGNLGRNVARGYGLFQMDVGLHKEFSLTERAKLQFRGEAFNLTNQTNFQSPNSSISSSSFGSITSTFPARQLQFALRLAF
jgi:Carboxypeptidase regulatory-like domain/TonB dependent receptor-like, beta-barrel/TonB-dependent Receptor Plug Domain